ncbi:MAG: type II toxin-antitoxin system RelE/ParE family toxin [Aeromicrobium sp.]|uniref:type II toxin-antitoxin system RelE/ParE family toxin n=1 Tax=Aeromicrobium sp. TaxID=1871063 RepID=UPI0039E3BFA5
MSKRVLRSHPKLSDDLNEALAYYDDVSPALADRLLDSFAEGLHRIEAHPATGVEYLPGWRRVVLRTFPYLVIYAVDEEMIHVVAMFHTRRDPDLIRRTLEGRNTA